VLAAAAGVKQFLACRMGCVDFAAAEKVTRVFAVFYLCLLDRAFVFLSLSYAGFTHCADLCTDIYCTLRCIVSLCSMRWLRHVSSVRCRRVCFLTFSHLPRSQFLCIAIPPIYVILFTLMQNRQWVINGDPDPSTHWNSDARPTVRDW